MFSQMMLFSECGPPADVVLVLDSSTSIGSYTFDAIKTYAATMAADMSAATCDVHLAVMKYR